MVGEDFYYHLLTVKLSGFPSLSQNLARKFVSVWHYVPPRPKTLDDLLNSLVPK